MKNNRTKKALLLSLLILIIISLLGLFLTPEKAAKTELLDYLEDSPNKASAAAALAAQMSQLEDSINLTEIAIQTLEAEKPVTPRNAASSEGPLFNIDFEPAEFPALASYEGVHFMIDGQRSTVDNEDFETIWADCVLKRAVGVDDYKLELFREDKTVTSFFVFPVFEGKAYGKAMKLFEKKMQRYQAEFQRLMQQKKVYEKQYLKLRNQWQKELAKIQNQVSKEGRAIY